MEQVRIGGGGFFVPRRIEKPSSFYAANSNIMWRIERDIPCPFDELGQELHSCRRFHIITRIADSVRSSIWFSSPDTYLETFSRYRKMTRVTRISTNFDHGGLPLVFPNAEIIPSVTYWDLFSQLARVFFFVSLLIVTVTI